MSVLAWIALGLAAGFVASKIVSNTGEGTVVDIPRGIGGAIVVLFLDLASFRGRMR